MNSIKQTATAIALHKSTNFFLIGLVVISLALYVFFANAAVRTLTKLENAKEDMQTLSVKVSEKESQRLMLDNSMSIALANDLGLSEVKKQTFLIYQDKTISYRR